MMRILILCAVIGAFWTINGTVGSAATLTVIRGDQMENLSTEGESHPPIVLRGTPAPADEDAVPQMRQISGLQPIGTGGNTLWLRDAQTGHIVACTVWRSGVVGRDKFRCTGGRR